MDAKVTWHESLHFTGTANEAPLITLDGNPPVDGQKRGMSPMQLLAISLAGCTAMDVISILQKMRQDVTGFEVAFHGERSTEHPKVFTDIAIEYIVHGRNLEQDKIEKAIELSVERYCSVQAMLRQAATIQHTYRIVAAPNL